MEDTYLTLSKISESLYKEKGSKFLAFAYPINEEGDVKKILDKLKKHYYDANHHCYAYILGKNQDQYRTNDDGEPNHSAGDPILGQIRSNELTNPLIVVIRYFGGTKLGIGGLITAYKTAAAEAIGNNEIIQAIVKKKVKLEFDYLVMNYVMRLVKDFDLEIINQSFDNTCQMTILIREGLYDSFSNKIYESEQVKEIRN
jgi:uncharacterized YigZ family protein